MLCWQMTTSEVREKDLCSKGYAALRQGASDWAAICFTIARTWELPTVWGNRGSSSVLCCSAQLLWRCTTPMRALFQMLPAQPRGFPTQSKMRNCDHRPTGLPASCRFNIEACAGLREAALTRSRVLRTRRTVGVSITGDKTCAPYSWRGWRQR